MCVYNSKVYIQGCIIVLSLVEGWKGIENMEKEMETERKERLQSIFKALMMGSWLIPKHPIGCLPARDRKIGE